MYLILSLQEKAIWENNAEHGRSKVLVALKKSQVFELIAYGANLTNLSLMPIPNIRSNQSMTNPHFYFFQKHFNHASSRKHIYQITNTYYIHYRTDLASNRSYRKIGRDHGLNGLAAFNYRPNFDSHMILGVIHFLTRRYTTIIYVWPYLLLTPTMTPKGSFFDLKSVAIQLQVNMPKVPFVKIAQTCIFQLQPSLVL
jgi:hypothetical protein